MDPRKKVKIAEQYEEYSNESDIEEEQNQFEQQEEFDEFSLREMLQRIEKNFTINSDLRSRFQNEPQKFIDSEVDLDEDIRSLQILSSYPHLIPIFYNSNCLSIVIQLMLHSNSVIVLGVVKFLQKLVDPENVNEPRIVIQLYDCLIKNYLIESLGELITKNEEKTPDDQLMLMDCFEIIENMIDIRKSTCKEFGLRSKIIQFLLKRIEDNSQAVDDVRVYASELLVMLSQETVENLQIIGRSGGIENLLIVLSQYSKNDPETMEEKEILKNVIDLLTLLLLHEENQDYFQNYEGLQLMFKLIKSKNFLSNKAYELSLQAINGHSKNCQSLIQSGGLALIFPILERKGLKNTDVNKQFKIDETTVLIIKQLFRWVNDANLKQRLVQKCKEKLDSFRKLRKEYLDIIPLIDPEEYDTLKEEQLEKIYLDLLGKGLIVIESIDVILLELKCNNIEVVESQDEIFSSVNQMLKYNNNQEDQQYYQVLLGKFENQGQ